MSSPRIYSQEDAEVAIKALEEIAKPGLARRPCGYARHGYPDKVVQWTHHCGTKWDAAGDCDNEGCDVVKASRALATIRAGAGTACSKCGGKGWYGADGAATPCNSVTCSAAARPGEAKGTGEAGPFSCRCTTDHHGRLTGCSGEAGASGLCAYCAGGHVPSARPGTEPVR